MGSYDFTIHQGATWRRSLIVRTKTTHAAISLVGCSARFQIREKYDSTTALVSLTSGVGGGIVLGGVAGTIEITITDEVTAVLSFKTAYADLLLTWPSGQTDLLFDSFVKLDRAATQ